MVEKAKTPILLQMNNLADISIEIELDTTIAQLKQIIHKQSDKYPFPDKQRLVTVANNMELDDDSKQISDIKEAS